MNAVEKYRAALLAAESQGPIELSDPSVLTGYSGRKLVGALQRFAAEWQGVPGACYLEVGVFRGLTLLSVAAANRAVPCWGIDNFAFFDREGKNLQLVMHRRKALAIENAGLINLDYEDALHDLSEHVEGGRVGTYFVDGPHDYRSQLMCLELALPFLHEHAVIVVDDSNYRDVRQANCDFLMTHPDFALLFEAYTPCHPTNMTMEQKRNAEAGWWNGVNILVHDPERVLARTFPPTERRRTLFENDRIIHSSNVAECVLRAIRVTQLLDQRRWFQWLRESKWLYDDIREKRELQAAAYLETNTYSEALPQSRFAPLSRP